MVLTSGEVLLLGTLNVIIVVLSLHDTRERARWEGREGAVTVSAG